MTLDGLLSELAALGITVAAEGDRLKVDAPAGALAPALRLRLLAHKPALLVRLGPDLGAPGLEAHLHCAEPSEAQVSAGPPAEPERFRIPLGWGRPGKGHGSENMHDWLEARGLRVIGGDPGLECRPWRPIVYLVRVKEGEGPASRAPPERRAPAPKLESHRGRRH